MLYQKTSFLQKFTLQFVQIKCVEPHEVNLRKYEIILNLCFVSELKKSVKVKYTFYTI